MIVRIESVSRLKYAYCVLVADRNLTRQKSECSPNAGQPFKEKKRKSEEKEKMRPIIFFCRNWMASDRRKAWKRSCCSKYVRILFFSCGFLSPWIHTVFIKRRASDKEWERGRASCVGMKSKTEFGVRFPARVSFSLVVYSYVPRHNFTPSLERMRWKWSLWASSGRQQPISLLIFGSNEIRKSANMQNDIVSIRLYSPLRVGRFDEDNKIHKQMHLQSAQNIAGEDK